MSDITIEDLRVIGRWLDSDATTERIVRKATQSDLVSALDPDYEAAARRFYSADDDSAFKWETQDEGVKDWYRKMSRISVDAALGLAGESME